MIQTYNFLTKKSKIGILNFSGLQLLFELCLEAENNS